MASQVLMRPTEVQEPECAARSRRFADTGGGWIVFLMAASIPISNYIGKQVDQQVRLRDITGDTYFYSTGNMSGRSAFVLILISAVVSLVVLTRTRSVPRVSIFSGALVLLLAWWLILTPFRNGPSTKQYEAAILGLLLGVAVVLSPPTKTTLRRLAWLGNIISATALIYGLAFPAQGQLPCRSDGKCGILGSLLVGYYPQENYLGLLVTLLAPTIICLRSNRARVLSYGLMVLTVLATGSRTALLAIAISGFVIAWCVRNREKNEARVPLVFLAFPFLAMCGSLYVFLNSTTEEFSGRGLIWSVVQSSLHGTAAIIGPGPNTLVNAYNAGVTGNFLPPHEHGWVPHLLDQTGLVGLLLGTVAFLSFLSARRLDQLPRIGLAICVTMGAACLTELPWRLDVRWPTFWSMLLAMGLLRMPFVGRDQDPETEEP